MSIGIRVDLGVSVGVAVGVTASEIAGVNPLAGVTRDSASLIYCPATTAEWQAVYLVAGLDPALVPTSTWLFQEASGDVADTQASFTLVASVGGLAYQQAEAGWDRLAITTTEGGAGVFTNTDAGLVDIGVGNCALLCYCKPASSGITRSLIGMGPAATRCAAERLLTTGVARYVAQSGTNGPSNATGAVRPWFLQYNRSDSVGALYTNQDKISPAFNATPTGKQITFGALQTLSATCSYLYGAMFTGNGARLTSAQVKTLLETLGWTIPWTP